MINRIRLYFLMKLNMYMTEQIFIRNDRVMNETISS